MFTERLIFICLYNEPFAILLNLHCSAQQSSTQSQVSWTAFVAASKIWKIPQMFYVFSSHLADWSTYPSGKYPSFQGSAEVLQHVLINMCCVRSQRKVSIRWAAQTNRGLLLIMGGFNMRFTVLFMVQFRHLFVYQIDMCKALLIRKMDMFLQLESSLRLQGKQ